MTHFKTSSRLPTTKVSKFAVHPTTLTGYLKMRSTQRTVWVIITLSRTPYPIIRQSVPFAVLWSELVLTMQERNCHAACLVFAPSSSDKLRTPLKSEIVRHPPQCSPRDRASHASGTGVPCTHHAQPDVSADTKWWCHFSLVLASRHDVALVGSVKRITLLIFGLVCFKSILALFFVAVESSNVEGVVLQWILALLVVALEGSTVDGGVLQAVWDVRRCGTLSRPLSGWMGCHPGVLCKQDTRSCLMLIQTSVFGSLCGLPKGMLV